MTASKPAVAPAPEASSPPPLPRYAVVAELMTYCLIASRVGETMSPDIARRLIEQTLGPDLGAPRIAVEPMMLALGSTPGVTPADLLVPFLAFATFDGDLGIETLLPDDVGDTGAEARAQARRQLGLSAKHLAAAQVAVTNRMNQGLVSPNPPTRTQSRPPGVNPRTWQKMKEAAQASRGTRAPKSAARESAPSVPDTRAPAAPKPRRPGLSDKAKKGIAAGLGVVLLAGVGYQVWATQDEVRRPVELGACGGGISTPSGSYRIGARFSVQVQDAIWNQADRATREGAARAILGCLRAQGAETLSIRTADGRLRGRLVRQGAEILVRIED